MPAVSESLLQTITELQALGSLSQAVLGGGTSLALRYGHRQSIDIDLFFSASIGRAGFEAIEDEVRAHFGDRVLGMVRPCDIDDQFIFLRFFLQTGSETIKVEVMQNFNLMHEPEHLGGVRIGAVKDIAMMKLMAVANRASPKDVYDLDYITNEINLFDLMHLLHERRIMYHLDAHRTIFDLDTELSPLDEPLRLLEFEKTSAIKNRPGHGDHRILPMETSKNWMAARSSYRSKVREYFRQTGIPFPGVKPIN
ncbi:MAG: nucleotidyl transferase AbiEii/AbiGii toxin family protein [Crocinitomicaceae bacterium]|nr:nucleotidyl transferase AbiEii/AbiGii toxin family protein [Crocinitomicaceae bacterium]